MYLPTKRPDWFNGSWYEVEHIVETDMSYGIVLRGQAMKLHRALKDLIRQNNVQSKYLTSGDETAVGLKSVSFPYIEEIISSDSFVIFTCNTVLSFVPRMGTFSSEDLGRKAKRK